MLHGVADHIKKKQIVDHESSSNRGLKNDFVVVIVVIVDIVGIVIFVDVVAVHRGKRYVVRVGKNP